MTKRIVRLFLMLYEARDRMKRAKDTNTHTHTHTRIRTHAQYNGLN
jgi:hypothetical protein